MAFKQLNVRVRLKVIYSSNSIYHATVSLVEPPYVFRGGALCTWEVMGLDSIPPILTVRDLPPPHTNPKECTLKPSGFLKNVFILHAFPALVHCSSLYVCAAEYFKALTLDIIQSAK